MESSFSGSEITQMFIKVKAGDTHARDMLTHFLYQELKHMAASKRHSYKNSQTLNTTALVNETWLKLKKADLKYNDKKHFLSVAALAMKQILLDDSRRKRFLHQQVMENIKQEKDLTSSQNFNPSHVAEAEWLHQLDSIIDKLEKHNSRLALVFNLKRAKELGLTIPADILMAADEVFSK